MSDIPTKAVARIDALTGLRFLAAMMVFCFHLDGFLKSGVTTGPMGAIAVSFFFVLSGFILTYVYRERLTRGGLKRFYFTRWARIWPLHAVCLVAALCLMPHGKPVDFPWLRIASHVALLQSWIPWTNYVLGLNSVAWSISTEAFFYFMFPMFLLGGLKHFWWKYLATVGFTIAALLTMTQFAVTPFWDISNELHDIVHFNPAFRLLEFVTGMATGYLFMSRRLGAIKVLQISQWPIAVQTVLEVGVLLAAATSFYVLRSYGFFRWIGHDLGGGEGIQYWFVYCSGLPFHAVCIFVFAQTNGWLARTLRTKPMIFLGEASFALYMVHRIVMWALIRNFWTGSTLPYWAITSSCLVVSLGISALLFLLVEIPFKTALLNCYDRKFVAAANGIMRSVRDAFSNKMAYGLVGMVLFPWFALTIANGNQEAERNKTERPSQIIADFELDPVDFGDQVSLVAWKFEPRRMGVEVSLVWKATQPTVLRHQYAMIGTVYKRTGRLEIPPGETIHRFFVDQRFWSCDGNLALKLWHKNVPLLPTAANNAADISAGGSTIATTASDSKGVDSTATGPIPTNVGHSAVYRLAIDPDRGTKLNR